MTLNMIYTLNPLAAPTFDWFLLILCNFTAFLAIGAIICLFVEFGILKGNSQIISAFSISSCITSFVILTLLLLNHINAPRPLNEQVCGNMIGYDSDVVGSKSKRLAGFVQYEMCDGSGIITLSVGNNTPYPKQAIFYKNPKNN